MTAQELKLIIFDCDGTLVDSQHAIISAMQEGARLCQLPVPLPEDIRHCVGMSLEHCVHHLYPDLSAADSARLVDSYKDLFQQQRLQPDYEEPLYPDTDQVIQTLGQQDHLILAVATGKARRGLIHTLEYHQLDSYFSILKTSDDGPGKPNPHILLQALDETGISAQNALMIGDTVYDMQAGQRAGCHTCGVTWGYHSEQDLRLKGANQIIHTYPELIQLLSSWQWI